MAENSSFLGKLSRLYTAIAGLSDNVIYVFQNGSLVPKPSYKSAPQTVVFSGLLTLPHGLGAEPSNIRLQAYVTVAHSNWAIGDTFDILNVPMFNGANTTTYGQTVWADATNIYVRCGNAGVCIVQDKTTGYGNVAGSVTNLKIIVRASL